MGSSWCKNSQKIHPQPGEKEPPKDSKDVKKEPRSIQNGKLEKGGSKPPENFFKKHQFQKDQKLLDELNRRLKKKKHKKDEELKENLSENDLRRNKILELFDRFDKWDFDIIEVSRLTKGYALYYCAFVYLFKYDLIKKFSLDEDVLSAFFEKVQSMYNNENPYHNCTRAAGILQSFHFQLRKGLAEFVSEVDLLASLIACCVIYLCHPGLDNHYQAYSESTLATRLNDISTLENVSCFLWVNSLYENDDYNIMKTLSRKQKREIREIVMDMVLATDLGKHRSVVRMFMARVESNSDFSSREDIRVLLQTCLKVSSVDFTFKPNSQYKFWVRQRLIEGFNQGDLERKEGLPPQVMFDRQLYPSGEKRLHKENIRFIDSYVKNFTKPYLEVFPKMKFMANQLRRNKDYWNLKYKKEDCLDFHDIQLYRPTHDAKKQQIELLSFFTSFKRPPIEKRVLNVPLEEQRRKLPKPRPDDSEVKETLIKKLGDRWSPVTKMERKPFNEDAVVYAVSDLKKHPLESLKTADRVDIIMKLFDRIDEYNFDVFMLEKVLNQDCLSIVSYVLFLKNDFLKKFKIQEKTLFNFLHRVQSGYQRNPYHNALHATDVMQITNSICMKGGVVEKMSDVDLMAAIVSSMVHDLDHPGLNDAFQVHSFSYLAKLYNDRSVLEYHHCAETFRLMREENLDIYAGMTPEQRRDCRKTMVDMIISTDMCNHAKYVKAFNKLIEEESQFKKKQHIRVALQIVIKMADVSNPSRPTYLYLQWTDCIIKEFFKQGDMEKQFGLPISPLMDREKSVISKGQMAFMEYVLFPMFKSFASVFPKFEFTLGLIEKNREYWKKNTEILKSYFVPTEENRERVKKFIDQEY